MIDYNVVIPRTLEEFQRDMVTSYNHALKDFYRECEKITNREICNQLTMEEIKNIFVKLIK